MRTESDKIRLHLVKELIADLIRFDAQLADHSKKIAVILDQHGTRLRDVNGVDPILAARILGCSGRVSGFPTAAAYANYTGTAPVQIASTAPVQIASTDSSRHRLSHYGDRQLNSAFYPIVMIQIRMTDSTGRAFYNKKIAEGKPPRTAARALKRYLAGHLRRVMLADRKRSARASSEALAESS